MKPGVLHAWLASLTELGAGTMLVLGLLTPLAAAGVVGVMLVALITNHMKNGFFIFRPGEGYEYVLTLLMVGLAIGAIGAGKFSIDDAIDLDWTGWTGLAIAAIAGVGGGSCSSPSSGASPRARPRRLTASTSVLASTGAVEAPY